MATVVTDVKLGHREYSEPVVVFAMNREAAPFLRLVRRDRLPVRVVVSGMGREAARAAVKRTGAERRDPPRLVVSAGFCGALNPNLRVGDVVVATTVLDWSGMTVGMGEAVPGLPSGRLLSVDRVIGSPAEKKQLHTDYAADIVDMESEGVCEAEVGRGGRFLAVRAVSDTSDTALSPQLVKLLAGGNVSVWRACLALLKKPSLLGEFRRLARDTRLAARNLAEALVRVVS